MLLEKSLTGVKVGFSETFKIYQRDDFFTKLYDGQVTNDHLSVCLFLIVLYKAFKLI